MKKTIITIGCIIATSLAFAGGTKTKVEDDGVLSNGFFLNIGVGMPTTILTKYDDIDVSGLTKTQNLGTQPTLEIGNQWYFHTTDNIGFGLKASWFQFGYSSFTNVYQDEVKSSAFDLKVAKVAPMFTYAVNEDIAFDASFEVAPSFLYLQEQEKGNTFLGARNDKVGTFIMGVTFAPGIRFRYTMFSLGYDYSFGTLVGSGTMPDGQSDNTPMSQKVANSRIYLGFQF